MEYKSDTYSNSLHLRHLNNHRHHRLCLHLLLLGLVLAYFPLTMAMHHDRHGSNGDDSNLGFKHTTGFRAPTHARDEYETNKGGEQLDEENKMQYCGGEFQGQCPPSACECPLTIEPETFKQLKNNLGPVIRQRLRELLKKALTVESAIETAHNIDLLKLLNDSNPELNVVRESMHKGAQQLRDAFDKIPKIIS